MSIKVERGVFSMLEQIVTVMGFMVVIFLFFFTLLHYLGKELHSKDAEHVDPVPERKY